jgi:hypothetical protein
MVANPDDICQNPSVGVECLALLLFIRKIQGSNLDQETVSVFLSGLPRSRHDRKLGNGHFLSCHSQVISHPTFPCHVVETAAGLRVLRGFAQSLQANGGILIGLDHEDLPRNPLKFAAQPSAIRRCKRNDTDSVIK